MPSRPLAPVALGIALVAGSIILLEIALTRVFAILLWHHLAYMVISIAMLGFGAAGSVLAVRGQGGRPGWPARALALLAAAYALAVLAALLLVTRLEIDTLQLWNEKANLARLAALYALIFVPFLFGGAVIGLVLSRLARHVSRLYGADLLGSAAGGAASAWLLAQLGSAASVVVAASLGAAAALSFASAANRRTFFSVLPAAALVGFACLGSVARLDLPGLPAAGWDVPFEPGKELARAPGAKHTVRLPSATAEVAIGPDQPWFPIIGGDFGPVDRIAVPARLVGQDGTAPTMLFRDAAELAAFPFLDDTQTAVPFVARRAAGGEAPRVLVIGVGGGVDVMVALREGAASVTAVEINRAMIRAITRDYDAYLGGLFRPGAHPLADRIELVHGEGRAFVRRRGERYDVIQLNGVDSFTALSTGAYTLSESYLYTTEAVRELYEHLEEGGTLGFSRFIMAAPRKPRETLRLAHIAFTALSAAGVADPASQILVFRGLNWATTLVKRGSFGEAELRALRGFAEEEGFWGLVFDPLAADAGAVRLPRELDQRIRGRAERVRADGRVKLPPDAAARLPDALHQAFRHAVAGRRAAADRTLGDLLKGLPPEARPAAAQTLRSVVWSEAARVRVELDGFRAARRDFLTLLGGDAARRRAFVESYEYDVRPATDDAPFFFNYYRYAGLLGPRRDGSRPRTSSDYYHPDYPVGHMVLLASLVQITLLAALCILLPLRALSRAGVDAAESRRVFLYFAALGMGFMFVEIVLMQKLVLFLGHPIYSITVVLTALLAASGLGSLASARLRTVSPRVLRSLLAGVLLAVLGVALLVDRVLPGFLGLEFAARVGLVVALLAPLGVVLGMAFPLGIRIVHARCAPLLPWAWAINGFVSVFSSILCIVLAMAIGFSAVLYLAAAIYAIGFLAMASLAERGLPGAAPA